MLQPKSAIIYKVLVFFHGVWLIWGCSFCRRITRGYLYYYFLQAHWGLSQHQPGRKSTHEARESAKGGKRTPDGDEKESHREMQGKEQAAGPRTNVAEGKTGIHGQRFIFTLFSFNLGLDFIKGKIQGKELSESQHERPRRGEHCINPCGCQSSTSAGSVGLGSATAPQTAGWALKAPLHPFTATRASLLSLSSPSL